MVTTITPQQVHEKLHSHEDTVIIDVLPRGYFKKQHLPKAINIAVDDIKELANKLFEKNRELILYCYDTECGASPKAAQILEESGFTNVYDLEEGIEGYKEAGYTVYTI